MKKLIFLISIAFFCSCKVTFTPKQSQAAIDQINKILTDGTNIFTSSDLTYVGNETEFANVGNEISDLMVIDLPRKKDILVTTDQSLLNGFIEISNDYKTLGTIPATVEANYNSRFKSYVHARQIMETNLSK